MLSIIIVVILVKNAQKILPKIVRITTYDIFKNEYLLAKQLLILLQNFVQLTLMCIIY